MLRWPAARRKRIRASTRPRAPAGPAHRHPDVPLAEGRAGGSPAASGRPPVRPGWTAVGVVDVVRRPPLGATVPYPEGMFLEIRTYRLKPGTRAAFVAAMEAAQPLLARYGIEVVDFGASLVAEDGHEEAYLIRRFTSLEERDEKENAFYGSADWRDGPRAAVVGPIESYHTIVLPESALTR
jgi:hypothetical protein